MKEHENFLSSILDTLQGLIYIYDIKTNSLVYVNKQLQNILGYNFNDLKKLKDNLAFKLIHQDDIKLIENEFNEILQNPDRKYFKNVFRILSKNGTYKHIECYNKIFKYDENKKPIQILGNGVDISDKIKFEKIIKFNEEKYSKMFNINAVANGLSCLDTGEYVDVNEGFVFLTGYSREEVIGKTSNELNFWFYPRQSEEIAKILGANKIVKNFEIKLRRKDGKVLTCLWSGQLIEINGEQYIMASLVDNTKNKKNETELLNARKIAEENDKFNSFILDLYIKAENVDSEYIIKQFVNKAIELTESEIGFFYYLNDNSEMINLKYWNTDNIELNQISHNFNDFFSNNPIWVKSLQEKKTVMVNNFNDFFNNNDLPNDHINLINILTVPIFEGENVVAKVVVANKNDFYSEKEIELLKRLCNNFWNIVRRKNAENQSLKLLNAVESSKSCVIITDFVGKIEYANTFFAESTGYSKEEYIGKNPSFLKSGYQNDIFYKNLWQTILSGNTWEGELQNKKKNGTLYWEHVIISPVLNYNNKITHFVAVKYDITESKYISEQYETTKTKAEEIDLNVNAIIENTDESIWAINKNYELTYLNQVFKSDFKIVFGVDLKIGDVVLNKLPESLQHLWKDRYLKAFNNERLMFEDEIDFNNQKIYIQVFINPIVSKGKVIGISFFGRNITKKN